MFSNSPLVIYRSLLDSENLSISLHGLVGIYPHLIAFVRASLMSESSRLTVAPDTGFFLLSEI
jgi:hypothetical protein